MKHKTYGYTALRRVSLPSLRGGIDASLPAHLIRDDRLHDAENVWWQDGALRTRPALKTVSTDAGLGNTTPAVTVLPDCAILYAKDGTRHRVCVVHGDGSVKGSTFTDSDVTSVMAVSAEDAAAVLYLGGSREVQTLKNDGTRQSATPYVPCVLTTGRATLKKKREESGALIEPVNLLTPAYTCRYTIDGEGVYYWLPDSVNVGVEAPLNITYKTASGTTHSHTIPPAADVRRESEVGTDGYMAVYEPSVRCFYFTDKDKKPIALPETDSADALTFSAECVMSERFRRIFGMTVATRYGGRVFVGGNGHRMHWSAVDNPLYFPENNHAFVGEADDAITAFGKQDDALVIFKNRSVYAAVEYTGEAVSAEDLQSGAVADTEANVWFPLSQIHSEVGCPHPATVRLCGDRLVWMAGDGRVYTLHTGGTYDAKRVRPLSRPIEPLSVDGVCAGRYGERYVLAAGNTVTMLDYSDTLPTDADRAVWFRWTFPCAVRAVDVGHTLYFLDGWRVLTLCDAVRDLGSEPIAVRVQTKHYELGAPERYKQLCAVTLWMQGDATVSVNDGNCRVAMATVRGSLEAPRRIPMPAPRIMRCGLVIEAEGQIAIDRIQTVYRRMGEIRE